MSGLNWGGTEDGPSPMDDKLAVRFFMEPVKDDAASIEAGRAIFRDVEYVEIGIPGDKLLIQVHPATEADRQRFAASYAAFRAGVPGGMVGTPLTEWPGVTRGQVEELAFFRVRTVEQLANLADANALSIGPVQALKRKAQEWLDRAKADAPFERLRAESAEKDERLAALELQLARQSEILSRLTGDKPVAEAPKRRGRPPKKQAEEPTA